MNEQEAACEAAAPAPPIEVYPRAGPASLPLPTWASGLFMLALSVLAQQGLYFTVNQSDLYIGCQSPTAPNIRGAVRTQFTAHYVTWFITCYNVLQGRSAARPWSQASVCRRPPACGCGHAPVAAPCLRSWPWCISHRLAGAWGYWSRCLHLERVAADYAEAYLQAIFLLLVFQIVEVAGIVRLVVRAIRAPDYG